MLTAADWLHELACCDPGFYMGPIHPRVKKPVGVRLAKASHALGRYCTSVARLELGSPSVSASPRQACGKPSNVESEWGGILQFAASSSDAMSKRARIVVVSLAFANTVPCPPGVCFGARNAHR